MKRKFISFLLVMVMVLACIPVYAAQPPDPAVTLEKIAERYKNDSNIADDAYAPWIVADMVAYADATNAAINALTDDQKQDFLTKAINTVEGSTSPSDLAKYIIAIRALGYDAKNVNTASGNSIDLVSRLCALVDSNDPSTYSSYTLPSVLIALQQDASNAQDQIDKLVTHALNNIHSTGGWEEYWFEDATSAMVLALAPYYNTNNAVKNAIDDALIRLADTQDSSGLISASPESTGLAMTAFASVGTSPASITTGSVSLIDGLFTYLHASGDGFFSQYSSGVVDPLTTEQGFRGLLSAVVTENTSAPFLIYDFSSKPTEPAFTAPVSSCPAFFSVIPSNATVQVSKGGIIHSPIQPGFYDLGEGTYQYTVSQSGYNTKTGTFDVSSEDVQNHTLKKFNISLSSSPPSANSDISVGVNIKTHGISCNNSYTYKKNPGNFTTTRSTTVTVKSGASVFDALDTALTSLGVSYVEGSSGYISSIDGLSELTHGPKSGWLYMVGSTVPTAGSRDYKLTSNTTVTWFFTDDYTSEYGSENWSSGSDSGGGESATAQDTVNSVIESKPAVIDGKASASISSSDIDNAIKDVQDAVKKAKDEGKTDAVGEVILKVTPGEAASSVDVALSASSAKSVADAGMLLTIDTGVCTATFDTEAIKSATSEAGYNDDVLFKTEKIQNETLTDEQKAIVQDNPVYDFTFTVGGETVTDFGGGSVTVFLPYTPKEGEDTDSLTVYYLDDEGNVKEMKGAKYDKDAGGLIFTTTHFSKFFIAPVYSEKAEWENPYKDVSGGDWFFEAVKFASQNGIMSGTSGNTFSPASPMTRAMMVTVLYNYSKRPAVSPQNTFSDVADDMWYTDAVIWADENGIAHGYGDGLFGVNDLITREQFATMLYQYADMNGIETRRTTNLASFKDRDEISSWALDAVKWANASGLLNGRSDDMIAPKGNATRAEAAALLMNYILAFETEEE